MLKLYRSPTYGVACEVWAGFSPSLTSQASAWRTIVSRSANCGTHGRAFNILVLSATRQPGSPARRGSITLSAREDSRMPEGAVFVPFCFVEAAATLLTHSALDPFGKIPEFKYCAARVRVA